MSDGRFESSSGTISPEGIVVKHFMEQIALLPQTWMGDGGFDRQKFNLQVSFLIRHLPDPATQKIAMEKWDDLTVEYKLKQFETQEIAAFAGMAVVSELLQFVYAAFELINVDIVGPATSRQYQESVITIPDLPITQEVVRENTDA